MSPKIAAIREEPILFAHRGGAAHAPENTLEAFLLGLKLGANGLESDVWVSADDQAVLIHDDSVGHRLRRQKVSATTAADLPDDVPTLAALFAAAGTDFELSLDIKTEGAIDPTINAVREASEQSGVDMVAKTWLCHPDFDVLTRWRARWSDVRLVHSTSLKALPNGPERHGAMLFEHNIDAVNLRQGDWQGGLIALYHRFGRLCFGWDAHLERVSAELLHMGCDAIFSDHVDRMRSARELVYGY